MDRAAGDGSLERNFHFFHGIDHALELVGDRTGKRPALGKPAIFSFLDDSLTAKHIVAVRHAGRAKTVGDDDHAVRPVKAESRAHHGRVDMYTVRDDLGRYVRTVRYSADDTRIPVGKGRHRVEKVHCMAGSGVKGFLRGCIVCIRVGE